MKVKSGIIVNGLQTILNLSEKSMPIKLTAKLLRLADDLTKENNFIEKQRRDIIEKYGDKDENGELIITNGNVTFSNENLLKAQEDLNELSNLEVDIIDREITENELENANLELTMNQFAILRNFLHSEEE